MVKAGCDNAAFPECCRKRGIAGVMNFSPVGICVKAQPRPAAGEKSLQISPSLCDAVEGIHSLFLFFWGGLFFLPASALFTFCDHHCRLLPALFIRKWPFVFDL